MRGLVLAVAVGLPLLAGAASANEYGPRIVSLAPDDGAKVAPGSAAITITFDEPMRAGWSFVTGDAGEFFPEIAGEPKLSPDGHTVTLPVKLAPDAHYVVWLNSAAFQNFRDAKGRPLAPYRLTFQTTH